MAQQVRQKLLILNTLHFFIQTGAVIASRLSENKDWNILLLEAGVDETIITDTPRLFPILQSTNFDWNYTFAPQENAFRCKLRELKLLYTSIE